MHRQRKAMDLLIAGGATWDIKTAAAAGRLDLVRCFMSNDAKQFAPAGKGLSEALHWAILGGQKETAEFLVSQGASVNGSPIWGEPPLYTAARVGDLEMVKLLLAHGADRNRKPRRLGGWSDWLGPTALQVAMMSHHPEVVKLLSQP